jgi:spore maturation protein CgeB
MEQSGMPRQKVILVGRFAQGALECSYASGFEDLGCEVCRFDIFATERRYCRLGAAGRLFDKFVPVEAWIRKANREMILKAAEFKAEVLVAFGQNRIQAGSLAQIRATSPVKMVYIWPDTLAYLTPAIISALPLYDHIGTYSKSTVPLFERLGGRGVTWLPLAADPHLHPVSARRPEFECDVAFVGQWRPEREQAVAALLAGMPDVALKIWGPDWGRRARDPRIRQAWQRRSLYGREFAEAAASCKVNLNIIDDTNFPAANMRFFEILCAGGLQVCSSCPEMAPEFPHGESVFYYDSVDEIPRLVQQLLKDDALRVRTAGAGREKVLKAHTYRHRAQSILG